MRQTRTRLQRPKSAASVAAIAVAMLTLSGAPAVGQDADGGNACAQRFHASLGRIAEAEYQAVKSARPAEAVLPQPAEPGLPGMLLFTTTSAAPRTPAETAALRTAVALARSRGRSGGTTSEDARWMADRLRLGLSDYLTQGPSPYLCGGVEAYVATLRGFAARLGPTPQQQQSLTATQRGVAERAVAAALDAMKPMPSPQVPPADRTVEGPMGGLRPTTGLERVDTSMSTGSTTSAAPVDPDLPPVKPAPQGTLAAVPDLVAAIDRLTATAARNGYLAATPSAMPIGGAIAVSAATHPVLARLAAARPLATGARPLVANRTVRLRLAAAFSAIEALDYLMRAKVEGGDPLAVAIENTFAAILAAHAADCTCVD